MRASHDARASLGDPTRLRRRVYARKGIVLNPHYKSMGNLYGSEYWTYLLPRRVGEEKALELMDACQAIGTRTALKIGLIDGELGDVQVLAESLANHRPRFPWHLYSVS